MIRKILIDDFYDKQPERAFEKELRSFIIPEINFCKAKDGFFPIRDVFLIKGDFAARSVLDTVYEDLQNFLAKNGLGGNRYPLTLIVQDGLEKEEYILEIGVSDSKITAGEPEGVRRAIIAFEDLLRENGGCLTERTIHRKYEIKRRISRCFFSPTNRPPKNGDELADDIDYYPDGYLNRLMHDGINAIWIYSSFDALVKTSLIPEYGEGAEKRIAKLNGVIAKCKRYGIDVFIFAMEPMSMEESAIKSKYGDIAKKYPQVLGAKGDGPAAFCPYTDFAHAYYKEAVEKLFGAVPDLAGIMTITQGERVTTCANSYGNLAEGIWINDCPHCAGKSRPEILSYAVNMIKEAIHDAKPQAEFISWTYSHGYWEEEMISYYIEHAPKGVALMQNFEDAGRTMQLKKKRIARDYWLSYVGPSHMFRHTANKAREYEKTLYAKMQICCSHELASVPYIPVPGIIYDKITRAKKLGVSGVMESWYFGNYPCLMSKAVEMLSTDREYASKESFLYELAALYWGGKDIKRFVKAWKLFERAYKLYPVNIMFGYYGPAHDGIVWELSLFPKNFSLSRSWQLIDRVDGDRIGECLFFGHTIDEAATLLSEMNELWGKGCDILSESESWKQPYNEQISVIKALGLLFDSASNIIEFYRLRNLLGYGKGDLSDLLARMKRLAAKEIENCRQMIPLCVADGRLGYHSEAEGYKFFADKLKRKIEHTEKLLKEDFPVAEKRIAKQLPVLEYYDGVEEDIKHYKAGRTGLKDAKWEFLVDGKSKFRVSVSDKLVEIELYSDRKVDFIICNEFELMFPATTMVIKHNGKKKLYRDATMYHGIIDERIRKELDKWQVENLVSDCGKNETHLKITLLKEQVNFVRLPYKMFIKTKDGVRWCEDPTPVNTLGKTLLSPADFGWIV